MVAECRIVFTALSRVGTVGGSCLLVMMDSKNNVGVEIQCAVKMMLICAGSLPFLPAHEMILRSTPHKVCLSQ